ncbi:MAG: dienelactone hydrolase family protein [Gammaproteobacteria bacterium]|jgi:dienelactone hydrolase|nr:dienelactone hydrolase family protein [Gammaproteobacteria bacterium]
MLFESEVEYQLNSSIVSKSFIAYDTNVTTPKPVVMILPDWRGRSDFYCNIARKIALLGYVGFAVDIYGNAVLGQHIDDKKILLEPLRQNRAELISRMQSVYNYISQQSYVNSSQIAGLGYCFGGMCVLDLVRAGTRVNGIVSLHGLLAEPTIDVEPIIHSKILILHGYEDTYVKPNQILEFANEMTRKKADWQIHIYGNTSHSFTKPGADDPALGLKYDAVANTRSWDATMYFLNEIFNA